jgi:ABC-type lipoprotein export system ATPase subunit
VFREARGKKTTLVVVSHDLRYKKRFDRTIDLMHINHAKRAKAAI